MIDDVERTEPDAGLADTVAGASRADRVARPSLPERLGRYRVLSTLGSGGMGIVYAAYDPELDRKVALKLIRPGVDDDEARSRLVREAHAMARVSHPNIVPVYDVGVHEERVYVAMEFVRGGTLREWLGAERRGWREIREVFVAAGRGLEAAHEVGLVHRDFKPENVLVGDSGRVLVTDFGLARVTDDAAHTSDGAPQVLPDGGGQLLSQALTVAGTLLGTPHYMSPEQLRGQQAGAASDQFSFCVALWEAIHGELPFEGDNIVDLAANVFAGAIRRPARSGRSRSGKPSEASGASSDSLVAARAVSAPRWFVDALERGLAPDPSNRWASVSELLSVLSGERIRRARLRVSAVLGAVVLGAAALGYVVWDRGEDAACVATGARIDEDVWPADRRDPVHRAFQTHRTEGDADQLVAALDGVAADWRSLRTNLCLAKRRGEGLPPHLIPAAERCFDEWLLQLDGFVTGLDEPDPQVLDAALAGVAGFDAAEICMDAERLRLAPQPPTDPIAADAELALRRRLAVARGRSRAGILEPAKEEMSALLLELDRIEGVGPLRAETLLALGITNADIGDVGEAVRLLREAYFVAGVAAADGVTATSAVRLAASLAAAREDLVAAAAWAEQAEMWVGRVPDPRGSLRVALHIAQAELAAARGDRESELFHQRARLALVQELAPGRTDSLATAWVGVSNALNGAGDAPGAKEAAQRALDVAETAEGPYGRFVDVALGALSNAEADLGNYGPAAAAQERALDILGEREQAGTSNAAKMRLNLAILRMQQGDMPRARQAAQAALESLSKYYGKESYWSARGLELLGNVERIGGQPEKGLKNLQAAMAIFERTPDSDPINIVFAGNSIAHTLSTLERFDECVQVSKRTIAFTKARELAATATAASTLLGLGECNAAIGRHAEAIENLEAAVKGFVEYGGDPTVLADARFALAVSLDAAGRDQDRVDRLAEEALAGYPAEGVGASSGREKAAAWIRERAERRGESLPPGDERPRAPRAHGR